MMASANRGAVFQQIDRLYRDGTLSGLGDGQLLERYLTRGDEAAFEALVNLHGPMVLGLCRRVLRDPRDIEDAFQATFLILVRKAPTIRDRGLLSNWLYGVAYRVARRARTNTLRRRDREIAVANLEAPAAPEAADSLGIGPVLDQELNRLPRKYRVPLILCYLEGHTHDQAAEELECPVGTVRSRLARGRDLLRRRLTSRGHAPTAAILGTGSGLAGETLHRSRPAVAGFRDGRGGPRDRRIQNHSGRRGQRVGPGPDPRSAHDHETRSIEVHRNGDPGDQPVGWWRRSPSPMPRAKARKVLATRRAVAVNAAGPQEKTGSPLTRVASSDSRATLEERLKALEKKLDELLSRSTPQPHPREHDGKLEDPFRRNPASS